MIILGQELLKLEYLSNQIQQLHIITITMLLK